MGNLASIDFSKAELQVVSLLASDQLSCSQTMNMLSNPRLSRPTATKTLPVRRLPCQHWFRRHNWTNWLPLTSGIHAYINWTGGHYRLKYKQCRYCGRTIIRKHRLMQPWRKEFNVSINQVTRPWIRIAFVTAVFPALLVYTIVTNLLFSVFKTLSNLLSIISGE